MARLGIDLDGVVYDFGAGLKHYLVTHEGFPEEQMTQPKVWDFFLEWGLSKEEYLAAYARGVDAGVVLVHGEPHCWAKQTMDLLREEGHTIHIVTYRTVGEKAVENTIKWLNMHDIPYDTITFAQDKTIVKTDIFLEDNVDNYLALWQAGTEAFLMDRPWNQHLEASNRVKSWPDFFFQIEERFS